MLSELLNNKKLKILNLVAGQAGITRTVSGAIMLDNPEMVNWMREGEILLTTGYVLKDNLQIQEKLITDLVNSNAGALVVKLKRYFDTIPRVMIEKANKLNFPIFELPYYMSLSELSEIINKHIYFTEKDINDSERNISELLFEIIHKNGNAKAILDLSESITSEAYALLDINMRTLFVSNNFSRYLDTPPISGRLLFSSANTKQYIDQIDHNTVSLNINIDSISSISNPSAIIYPIKTSEEILGYLFSVSNANSSSAIGTDLVRKKIILALSILFLREKATLSYKSHKFDIVLERLLNNETLTADDIKNVSVNYNFPINSYYICCLVSFTKIQELNSSYNWIGYRFLKCDQIISYWHSYYNSNCILFPHKNNLIVILQIENKNNKTLNSVKNFCNDIQLLLTKNGIEKDVLIGIGDFSHGLKNLCISYYQAQKTIDIMSKTKYENIGAFENYLIYTLLNNTTYVRDALKEKLMPLIYYDQEHNTELLLTLEIYINNKYSCTHASKSLFIHRNTLLYRLDKIKEILDIDYDNPDEILTYQLAIKALSL